MSARHPLHATYTNMTRRCLSPEFTSFKNYGARGVIVCDRWLPDNRGTGFRNFLEDMGPRPDGMTLDRINNDGPYSPENCRWSTAGEQQWNSRNSKLTKGDIPRIFEMRSYGFTYKAIAMEFGVCPQNIGRVLNGRAWRDAV